MIGILFFILVIGCLILLILCFYIPGCPCYCGGTQHRRHWFLFLAQNTTQPQAVGSTIVHTTGTQQVQLQPMPENASQLPYKGVPYEGPPVEQPPPYYSNDQLPYPPEPINAF